MDPKANVRQKHCVFSFLIVFIVTALLLSGPMTSRVFANPFETLPANHWSYEVVSRLAQKGLIQGYVDDRIKIGYNFTYFDLTMWVGGALQRLTDLSDIDTPTFAELVHTYNDHADQPLSEVESRHFHNLVVLVWEYLDFLGYPIPLDIYAGTGNGVNGSSTSGSSGVASVFDRLRGYSGSGATESLFRMNSGLMQRSSELESSDNVVTAQLLPPLVTLEGEVEVDRAFGIPSALRVGALIHPGPDLTLGALYFAPETPWRLRVGGEEEVASRLDLSAEIGEWILSLRRKDVLRGDNFDSENMAIYTRFGVEYVLGEHALIRAGQEREMDRGADGDEPGVRTEVDLEVSFEKGKVGLGFVLESVHESKQDGRARAPITTTASIEHAIGPLGVATAGISFGHFGEGREASSNVGLRYEFDNASLRLNYKVSAGHDDAMELTTAEVSIKF